MIFTPGRVFIVSIRLVIKTRLENLKTCTGKLSGFKMTCHWSLSRLVLKTKRHIVLIALENLSLVFKKTCVIYVGILENQIELFEIIRFWDQNRDAPNFLLIGKM